MKRSLAILCCLGLVVGFGGLAVGQTFDLTWSDCPDPPPPGLESPQGPLSIELTGTMTPGGLAPGDDGAQGWSLSVIAGGACTLDDITTAGTVGASVTDIPPGLRDTGFEKSELTTSARPGSACDGVGGGVSAVVLSFTLPITLDPVSPSDVVKVTLGGTVPPAGECELWSVAFANACQGSGQPVDNKVTHEGLTVLPSLGSCEFNVCGKETCEGTPLKVIVQDSALQPEPHETLAVNDGLLTEAQGDDAAVDVDAELSAQTGSLTLYHAIVSDGLASGVQGWSLSIRVTGDIVPTAVTTDGTAAADEPDGLRSTGFEKSETVDPNKIHPDTGEPQGEGVVSAVVLSFTLPITLQPTGTATALALTVESAMPVDEVDICGRVEGFDNMTGSGQPVKSVATVSGQTREFGCIQAANVCFTPPPPIGTFIRCDPNEDNLTNIADAVWIVNELFRGGPPTRCEAAADCNDDGLNDLSDATYCIAYRFLGGLPPPAPFPGCGPDPTPPASTTASCPAGSNGLCP